MMKVKPVAKICSAVALLVTILATTQLVSVLAEVDEGWPWPFPRHSIGFPQILNESMLNELVKYLEVRGARVSPLNASTSGAGYIPKELVSEVASRLGVSPSYIESVIKSVNDEETRRMLITLLRSYANGQLSVSQLLQFLKQLGSRASSGQLSVSAYEATLDLVKRISESLKINFSEVYQLAQKSWSIPRYLSSLLGGASIAMPTGFSLPSASLYGLKDVGIALAATFIAIAIAIALIAILRKIKSVTALSSRSIRRVLGTYFAEGVVREYWRAVQLISAKLGISRMDWETHWEFFAKVSKYLGSASEAFRRLTELYELRRFGGVKLRDMDEEARRCTEVVKRCLESM